VKPGLILSIFFLTIAPSTVQSMAQSRPMDQMHGGCDHYAVDLKSEMHLMAAPSLGVTAASAAAETPGVPASQALEVTLLPQSNVHFILPPAQNHTGPDRRAGLLSLGVLPKGDWRVSADQFVWIDMVGARHLLASPSFEMQTGCAVILKTVVFHVPEAMLADLQLSGANSATVKLLITPAAAAH
jgi:hypothetical protein